jgi:hypothetical protein
MTNIKNIFIFFLVYGSGKLLLIIKVALMVFFEKIGSNCHFTDSNFIPLKLQGRTPTTELTRLRQKVKSIG